MNIEFLNPKALTPHPQNSRKHSEEQIQQLMASITQFGFNGTILIDENDVILAGHGRTQAMIRLGRETIPCLRKEGLTELEKRAYVIADNAIGLNSEWDEDVLNSEVAMLLENGFDISDFGIPVGVLEELEAQTSVTVEQVKELETKAAAPLPEPEQAKKEIERADLSAALPIVPEIGEQHEAFVIVCDLEADAKWLREKLGLKEPLPSAEGEKPRLANVVTCSQFRERLQ